MSRLNVKVEGMNESIARLNQGPTVIQSQFFMAMRYAVNKVKNRAQDIVAYKTGTLRRSIQAEVQNNGFRGIVYQDTHMASYGPGIEFGTKAHIITVKDKKVLASKQSVRLFFDKKKTNFYTIYGKSVKHPGTKPQPFMAPALEWSLSSIQNRFKTAVRNIAKALAGQGGLES